MKPTALSLPSAADVIPKPAERPVAKVGDDLGLVAVMFKDYGDRNAALLAQARENYEAVARAYAQP